jgi:hypothetical protein
MSLSRKEDQSSGWHKSCPWFKVPYLTANHFAESYNNITYFQNVPDHSVVKYKHVRQEDDIHEFSSKSRVRALKRLSMIDPELLSIPYFVTLTYHNSYPSTARAIKTDLDNFLKRLRRLFPSCYYFWRIELQNRGAPHYHFIIWFPAREKQPDPTTFYQGIKSIWIPYINCGCSYCNMHSIDFQRVTDMKQAIFYVNKYLAKSEDHAKDIQIGRIWGTSRNLPYTQKYIFVGHHDFVTLLQHACILWNIQYTMSNVEYLSSLLFRPTVFLFIPHQIVERLSYFIQKGCEDPLTEVANEMKIQQRRQIVPLKSEQAQCLSAPPTCNKNIPAVGNTPPLIADDILNQCYRTLCANTSMRKHTHSLKSPLPGIDF